MSYYGELCTRMYEVDKSIAEGKELDFYLSFADREDIRVLEPMCGNGRMLIPFMQRGINIEGFDISEDMLKVCREKGNALNLIPQVFFHKIEEFVATDQYDLIMIPFGSFSLLPTDLIQPSLANMRSALKEDGRLLLTIMLKGNETEEIAEWREESQKQLNDERIVLYKKVHYDQKQSTLVTRLKYQLIKDQTIEKTEIMDFPVRLYKIEEFEQLLKSNGFQQVQLHEVKDGYGEGTSFHVFECS
ncbi:bifunctional 2-polyprenyl-6-hydroxyphenol methylase/3-demethylubiquinol 3-O-methyltransferase UbiG [Paenibacillus xylanexedens]|uniref:class I SAM-dependent methyltransferase n=1 Tax=Paenibacillus xylanexedens TaxID=528191 RepID=UPI0011A6A31C|nr:class I SAM-dependent methyltransferase [Paenibacillus xylanexedens]